VTAIGADWASRAIPELLLSLRAPRSWELRIRDEDHVGLFSDVEQDDYTANITFFGGEPQEPGAPWFAEFCRAAPGQLAATVDDYDELGSGEFRSSSRARVFWIHYRQHAVGAPPTSHLQAYMWVDSYRMYIVDGATPRATEDRDLPIFDAILRSVRVLPVGLSED
jgi:hypothetical protein